MVGTRGGLGRIAAAAIGLAAVLALVTADAARGGTYRVAQCGWGVGVDNDPVINAFGPGFVFGSGLCASGGRPEDLRLEALPAPNPDPGWVRARWTVPSGSTLVGAQVNWTGSLQPGFGQFLGVDIGNELKPLVFASGTTPTSQVAPPIPAGAWALEILMNCELACSRSAPSTLLLRDLTMTILDPRPPATFLGGTTLGPGWLRGTAQLDLAAEDVGAGVSREEVTVDGAGFLAAPQTCAALAIEGELRAIRMRPCPVTAKQTFAVDTTRIADGVHTLRGCAIDFAGETGCAPDATIKVDNSAPAIAFADAREGQVAVKLSDPYSGPAGGSIAMQRAGEAGWADLATRFEAGPSGTARLTADLPAIGDGSYAFRAVASDALGNAGSAQISAKGTAAEVVRQVAAAGESTKPGLSPRPHGGRSGNGIGGRATHISVRLRRAGARGSSASELTVPFGTSVEASGRLTSADGDGIPGATVEVLAAAAHGGSPRRAIRRVRTGRDGRFDLRLPAGPSRRVVASFQGGDGMSSSRSRALALRVGAAVSLEARPRVLATGETVLLHGRVSPGSARIPRRGKVVTIQYLERAGGDWRPALVVRTDRRGRFHVRYRFRYVSGEARIRLRATALPEAGWPYAEGSSAPLTVTVRG